jgi:hypothetical protein
MIINLKDDQLKISKNENNRFWNPIGSFYNISEIYINNKWYKCGVKFQTKNNKQFILISDPIIVDRETSEIKEIVIKGLYKEFEISKFKGNLIKYLLNIHDLNHKSFVFRKQIIDRRRTIIIFSIALIPSIAFFLINRQFDNIIIKSIAENTWIQTLFFFLTISGFISIFHPFSIKKEIEKEDIEEIVKDTINKQKQDEKIRDRNSF